jgi:hypothetical protein
MEKKIAKKSAEEKKNASNKKSKDKKTLTEDGTFIKNIIFKEVLTP